MSALPRPAGHVPPHRFDGVRGTYAVRTACPEDSTGLRRMFEAAPAEDVRLRFFRHLRYFPQAFIEPLTRADERRHFAFVASPRGSAEIVGSAVLVAEADAARAEFAIFVARPHAGQGLGTHLLECLFIEAREHRIPTVYGYILAENRTMIDLARSYGFTVAPDPDDPGCLRAEMDVTRAAALAAV